MDKEAKNQAAEDDQKDLETLLSEMGGAFKLLISRITPTWCDGRVQTLDFEKGDAVDWEEVERQVGGHKLLIKVYDTDKSKIVLRRHVKFSGVPPKKYGLVVTRDCLDPQESEKKGGGGNEMLALFMKSQETLAATQAQHQKDMAELSQKQNETIQNILMDRIKEKSDHGSNGSGSKTPQESLKEAAELVEFLEGLKGRIKGDEETVSPVTQQVLGMAETFFEFKLDQEKSKFEQKIHEQKQNSQRDLPERDKKQSTESKPSADDISDEDLFTESVSRFHDMPTAKQRVVAEMFFKQQNSKAEPVASGASKDDRVESEENDGDNENSEYSESDDQIELDPDDENELDSADENSTESPSA